MTATALVAPYPSTICIGGIAPIRFFRVDTSLLSVTPWDIPGTGVDLRIFFGRHGSKIPGMKQLNTGSVPCPMRSYIIWRHPALTPCRRKFRCNRLQLCSHAAVRCPRCSQWIRISSCKSQTHDRLRSMARPHTGLIRARSIRFKVSGRSD